jgi:hypothetical protein
MSAEALPPHWTLISVLFSSQPLTSELATTLCQVALDLHQRQSPVGEINAQLVQGTVTNLHRDVLLGSMGGPSFEAELETERGHCTVRFFLTRQALRMLEAREAAPPTPSMLH